MLLRIVKITRFCIVLKKIKHFSLMWREFSELERHTGLHALSFQVVLHKTVG